ncbi:DNA alkylation repair protein [Paenibacillus sp. YPG26]|uniref:DNA alkylation repair protein n=1 Tax=Paenibacillus sp. YPG26 TaxID=2878915 RepID=UPI002041450B|nr:DNA alkylation repair protein [Paenibacillus sp. YPG26]USB31834.1 DNA alkylation repair protein [Paenibacillus sp. YPG26]
MDALKDLYSRDFFDQFVCIVKEAYSLFDEQTFLNLIYDDAWEDRELKQRIRHIAATLTRTLPDRYGDAIGILTEIAPKCKGFEYLFFPDFVELNGLEHYDISIRALEHFTSSSSSEFAVRPFIIQDPERMMQQMLKWSSSDSEHVRRLASEGCRPRLPWGISLTLFKQDPQPILPILEALKEDTSEYVRKSVANNLNDISKDHPELVLDIAKEWNGHNPNTDWIVRHGLRTLIKRGNPQALALFGLGDCSALEVQVLTVINPSVIVGDYLHFSFDILNQSDEPRKVRIEYEIGYMRSNGQLSLKRFKLSERLYNPGVTTIVKKQSFKPITTRKYYPGMHRLGIIVNGQEMATVPFELMDRP